MRGALFDKTPAAVEGGDAAYEAIVPAEERPAPARRAPEKRRVKTAEGKARTTVRIPRVNKAHEALRTPRVERAGGWLELLSSVAVILVCLCAGWAFLALV